METLIWIIFGIMIGWMASVIMGAVSKEQILKNILLGILGSLAGSLLINLSGDTGFVQPNSLSVTTAAITSGFIIWFGKFLSRTHQDIRNE